MNPWLPSSATAPYSISDELHADGWEPSETWQVFRDGIPASDPLDSESAAVTWLLEHHGTPVEHACTHDGYAVRNTWPS